MSSAFGFVLMLIYLLYSIYLSILSIQAWEKALNNAKVQYELQQSASINIELSQEHAAFQWLQYNRYLDSAQQLVDREIGQKKRKLDEVQMQRRRFQEDFRSELARCKGKKEEMLHKQMQIIATCRKIFEQDPELLDDFNELVRQLERAEANRSVPENNENGDNNDSNSNNNSMEDGSIE